MQLQTDLFIKCLFDNDDQFCTGSTPFAVQVSSSYDTNSAFVAINALKNTRSDANVIKYRNILIEMDKMPLDKQDQYITEIGLPYSTAVYSGGKSIHYVISLMHPIADEALYRALVRRVYKAVGNDVVDQSNKNPSRFSRLPGHIRQDSGKEQKLLNVNSRVPNSTLEEWLDKRGAYAEELWENLTPEPKSTFKNPSRLYAGTKNFLMYGTNENWNLKLFKAAADMCRCGFTEQEATNELMKVTGTLDFNDHKTISSAFKNEAARV